MNIIKRFWKYVVKGEPDECWNWLGSLQNNKYGHFRLKGRPQGAHRVSWAIAHKIWPIPKGKQINHTCDNPSCVNPNHLYLGTSAENAQDASTLTPEDIINIKILRKSGCTHKELSYLYGVHIRSIERICRGKRWSNII